MKAIAVSKQGSRSAHNEDACLVLSNQNLYVVADGVGGGPAGNMASRCLVNVLADHLESEAITPARIGAAIESANDRVRQEAFKSDNDGMASTLVLAWREADSLHCFHVGDSRIYRVRAGALTQLTRDHTRVVRRANGATKSVVTQAIGVKETVFPDISEHTWEKGDALLLLSDGISDMLMDQEIEKILKNPKASMAEKVHLLIEKSEQAGGSDDKTIVIVFE
jgi:protein phosphatase